MTVTIVTGSGGLIGAETVRRFARDGHVVAGIDNDMRGVFFGADSSTRWSVRRLQDEIATYEHHDTDIRDIASLERIFRTYGDDIGLVVHTAAQPSHDWAAKAPLVDFGVNAQGTLNMLEMTRQHAPSVPFIFTSTNKVYGDLPNELPLVELDSRWEVDPTHPYARNGIDETMSIDRSMHSVFGASKVAADVMVQEYGRYFGMNTVCFRGGCLTGPGHSGAELHGFLSFLVRTSLTGDRYRIYGYKGKQVRDNIHAHDLVEAFYCFARAPRSAEVYNIGGGRASNCSMLEAISMCEELTGKPMNVEYVDDNRNGDHIWWISDVSRFESHYPHWSLTYDVKSIIAEIATELEGRLDTDPVTPR